MDCKRADGLNMGYDPYSPEMVAKYGAPGQTDDEGFNPYADTVGPGIYGGRVKRDPTTGDIVIGKQYQVSEGPFTKYVLYYGHNLWFLLSGTQQPSWTSLCRRRLHSDD